MSFDACASAFQHQHVLVTGGTGFLGSWIIKRLLELQPELRITILDIAEPAGWEPPESNKDVRLIQADVTNKDEVFSAFETTKPTAVIHSAAIIPAGNERYTPSKAVRDRAYNVNVNGTKHVLEAAKAVGVKCFIYTSSVTILSDDIDNDYPNMNEDTPIGNASLLYGWTKTHAETHVLASNNPPTFTTCSLRPSVLFGTGDQTLIPTLHSCIRNHETPFQIGPGTNLYDFTYVGNVADAHALALANLLSSSSSSASSTSASAAGLAIFISNGTPVTFRDFCLAVWKEFDHVPGYQIQIPVSLAWVAGWCAEWVTWMMGTSATLTRGSVRDATQTAYVDLGRARVVLGYEPRIGLEEGIRRACEDLKRRLQRARETPKR